MFTWVYAIGELSRRRGRAVATALGLAVGVALVAVVGALGAGLSDAQDEVLAPLTGIGTDISVERPLRLDDDAEAIELGPGSDLSEAERARLEEENGETRLAFDELGDPGDPFATDRFATTDLSFDQAEVESVASVDGVEAVAASLTLQWIRIEGTVPDAGFGGGPGGGGARGPGGDISFTSGVIAGVDVAAPDLALVAPSQVVEGRYLADGTGSSTEAIVSESYAGSADLVVGDTLTFDGTEVTVVGVAAPPLGGESADVYVDLATLQRLSDREGRANGIRVQAADDADVEAVASGIERAFPGSRATTSAELAGRVQGSLTDAKDLVGSLGTSFAIVALAAAVALASLLMLGTVARRTRELGTLKAVGWPSGLLVRQIAVEALVIGAVGAVAGVALGWLATLVVGGLGITLDASAEAQQAIAVGPPGGADEAVAVVSEVAVGAPLDPALIALAAALAIAGALVAGAVAAGRIARLSPADALRNVD